jgi:tetratricopeptide (TPR) repeat protein
MASKAKAKARPLDRATATMLERAAALHRGGKLADAETLYRDILVTDAQQFDALHLLGVVRYQQGHNAEAEELIRAARAQQPHNVSALSNHGIVLSELGRHAEALACYDRALVIEPRHAGVLNNRGTALKQLGRHAEALACHDRAIAIDQDFADAVSNRGMLLETLERFEDALICFDKAIALDPTHTRAHHNRGAVLHRLDRFEEAVASFDRAIAVAPAYAKAFYHRGRALRELRRHDEALASYRQATALDPENSAAHWEAGLLALLRGDFAAGWPDYEWRLKVQEVASAPRDFAQPQWRGGAPLAGRTILLHAEQGFGDTIQFARYAPLVAARGATVVLEVQRALGMLLHGMTGVSKLVCRDEALPEFDLHCPLASLPLAFATTLDTVPAQVPYLRAPTERIAAWRVRLPAVAPLPPRVGLVWSGDARHKNDSRRSMAFEALAPLVAMPGFDFVSLQKNPREADVQALRHCNVIDIAAELKDFADTAAVISLIDLVITVDTSVAHLAGSLGKPVWILLPVTVDWRWLLNREDSPWYPTARLFRQASAGDWDGVIARVGEELAKQDFLQRAGARQPAAPILQS